MTRPTPFVGRTSSRERPFLDGSIVDTYIHYYSYLTLTRVQWSWSWSPRLLQQTVPVPPSYIPNAPCSPQRQSNPSINPSWIHTTPHAGMFCTYSNRLIPHTIPYMVLLLLISASPTPLACKHIHWFRSPSPAPLLPQPSENPWHAAAAPGFSVFHLGNRGVGAREYA
jgi:hypothetical protein